MPHSDNQLARLQLSFSKNPNPTKEECEALGKGIDLTVQQVQSWFKYHRRRSSQSSVGSQDSSSLSSIRSTPFTSKDTTNSSKILSSRSSQDSSNPLSKGSSSKTIQVPKRITESNSKAAKSTLEGDNFNPNTSKDKVYDLLGFNPRLTSPSQVMPFSRIIVDITEGKQDPKLILDIMNACTDKAVYHEVLKNPIAVTALYNLRTIIGHTGKYVRDYLNILLKLPFDMKVFGECNFVTYAKTVKKKNLEDHDLIKLADYVRRNWQTAAEAAAFKVKNDIIKVAGNVTEKAETTTSIENKNTRSKKPTVVVAPKRPFQNTDGKNIDGKRLKTDDKKSPSASSFFKRLNEPATLPKIKVSESKQTSGPESAESVDAVKLAFDEVQIPSYRKTSANEAPMEVDDSINSSGKKSVRFKGAAELQSIKIFEMEDPPMKISIPDYVESSKSSLPVTRDDKRKSSAIVSLKDFKATPLRLEDLNTFQQPGNFSNEWPVLREILIHNSILAVPRSVEAATQTMRESCCPPFSCDTLPDTPDEPEDDNVYRPHIPQITWHFNTIPIPTNLANLLKSMQPNIPALQSAPLLSGILQAKKASKLKPEGVPYGTR